MGSLWTLLCLLLLSSSLGEQIDLSDATIVVGCEINRRIETSIHMLIDEVEKRSHLRLHWETSDSYNNEGGSIIWIGKKDRPITTPMEAEGFNLYVLTNNSAPVVMIEGFSDRGVLYGVGKLLRELHMDFQQSYKAPMKREISIDSTIKILNSVPAYQIRGQMFSYRGLSNSYDGWSIPQVIAFIRDMAVWGANQIEMVSPDGVDSPNFRMSQSEMIIRVSEILIDYDINMSIWYPTGKVDGIEWGAVFKDMPKLDSVFVPSGDPGGLEPRDFFNFVESKVEIIRKFHPACQIWISHQLWNATQLDVFYDILTKESPRWLTGVVYGPHARDDIKTTRDRVPAKFPIRLYPDLGHGLTCQFPNPDWDYSLALTEAREMINPRPSQFSSIFRQMAPYSIGFGEYSDGCNDDVNKITWAALSWEPSLTAHDIVTMYSRYFIGISSHESFAKGIFQLEENWMGTLDSTNVAKTRETLRNFENLFNKATPFQLENWRFQQNYFRALFDHYVHLEKNFQVENLGAARQALSVADTSISIPNALKILNSQVEIQVERKFQLEKMAEALFQSIHMELSVSKYFAISIGRGACMDTLQNPVSNSRWFKFQLENLLNATRAEQIAGVSEIMEWETGGPGGYYDDLGTLGKQPHLVVGKGWENDPSFYKTALNGFWEPFNVSQVPIYPLSWYTWAESLYNNPLSMEYRNLNTSAQYCLSVVYVYFDILNLKTSSGYVIQNFEPVNRFAITSYDIPRNETNAGYLNLTWTNVPGYGSDGRGLAIAEVWLRVK